jgi:excisionase family DNA binding protein
MRPDETPSNSTPTDALLSGNSLLKTKEVAALLNVNRFTIDRLVRQGKLPVIRIGKDFRFAPAAVRQLIADSTVGGVQ